MRIIILLFLILGIEIHSQVAIAQNKNTPDGDGILDFENPTTKGISLPKVITLKPSSVPGTLYFDTNDSKVKFLGTEVMDLSVKEVPTANQFNLSSNGYQDHHEVQSSQGVVLGDESSTATGVLVLESTDKALILPKATSYTDVKDPEPGMIVYDKTKKMLCVYNGFLWTFWGKE